MPSEETMIAPVPATVIEPPAFHAPAAFDFTPKNLAEAMQLSEMLASSTMVPKDFQGRAGNCFLAMQWGAELGMKPMQAIQNIAVINGKPGIYGDVGKAMLLARGFQIIEDDARVIEASGYATCTVISPSGVKTTRTFSIADAKTAGLWGKSGPWQTYPFRQMAWRAFWFAARDGAAHVLKGMAGVEELRDLALLEREVVGETVVPEAKPEPPKATKSAEVARKLKEKDQPKPPTLAEVEKAFAEAANDEQLTAAVELAKRGVYNEEEKKHANTAYRVAHGRLHPPAPKPADAAPTLNDVKQMLGKATTLDELDAAAAMIDQTEADPELKAAATADYKAIRAKLVPAS